MNDQSDDADARIRALLAELGSGTHGEAMPAGVAARLDEALARLVTERTGADPEEEHRSVPPLHRRRLTRVTAAAAAVVVLGIGGVAAAHLGLFGSSSPGSASGDRGSASAPSARSASPTPSPELRFGTATGLPALPRISSGSFTADVRSLLGTYAAATTPHQVPAAGATTGSRKSPARANAERSPDDLDGSTCPGPHVTGGTTPHLVQYDGTPAVLLVHPLHAGQRLVEAWDCAGDRVLARTTIDR